MPPDHPFLRLILTRHAQAGGPNISYGSEAPLTPRGQEQAQHLATALEQAGVTHIVSSPFTRAVQTAHPARERLHCAYREDPRLIEFQLGDETEASIAAIINERRYLMLWQPHDQLTAGGETLARFQARVSAFLDELARDHLGAVVAVVTHAGTIAAATRWAFGLSPQHDWHSDVELFNASLTEIQHWPNGRHPEGAPYASAIRRLNDVRHLPSHLVTEY